LNPKIVELPGKNPNVDIKIVNYIVDKDIILATLDKDLKNRIKNKILTIRGKSVLEII
jgi:predicted nuclease of predicted toxin-antitoxin system